jgi:hypothetical protein
MGDEDRASELALNLEADATLLTDMFSGRPPPQTGAIIDRLREAATLITSLREALEEAETSAKAARENFHTMQGAANELRKEKNLARSAKSMADDLLTAAVSDYNDVLAHLQAIIAADDDFRASMAPGTEKDPVTLACDRAREVANPSRKETGDA